MKPNLKDVLSSSIAAEQQSVKSQFDVADKLFGNQANTSRVSTRTNEAAPKTKPAPKPKAPKIPTEPIVRDIFSMPESDYKLIEKHQMKCAKAGIIVNRSELVRLALIAFDTLPQEQIATIAKKLVRRHGKRKISADKI